MKPAVYISYQDADETTVGLSDRPVLMRDVIHQNACSRMDTCSIGSTWHLGTSFYVFFICSASN
jgi:hypothetical protein